MFGGSAQVYVLVRACNLFAFVCCWFCWCCLFVLFSCVLSFLFCFILFWGFVLGGGLCWVLVIRVCL